jgi:hypothetical protein
MGKQLEVLNSSHDFRMQLFVAEKREEGLEVVGIGREQGGARGEEHSWASVLRKLTPASAFRHQ